MTPFHERSLKEEYLAQEQKNVPLQLRVSAGITPDFLPLDRDMVASKLSLSSEIDPDVGRNFPTLGSGLLLHGGNGFLEIEFALIDRFSCDDSEEFVVGTNRDQVHNVLH